MIFAAASFLLGIAFQEAGERSWFAWIPDSFLVSLFLLAGIMLLYVFLTWNPIVKYLKRAVSSDPNMSLVAFIIVGVFVGGLAGAATWWLVQRAETANIAEEARRRLDNEGIGWHYTMYHERARLGDLERVRRFWQGGMAVDIRNDSNQTVLHFAARGGYLQILREALDRGADVNAEMIGSRTPLYEAIQPGHEHIVRELITRGAEIDHRTTEINNTGGCTALSIAAFFGYTGIARLLVDAGARLDIANGSGATPVMVATIKNHPEIVSFLVEKGADLSLRDKQGANAMDYALAAQGTSRTVEILSGSGVEATRPRKMRAGEGASGGCIHITWRTEN